MDLKNSTKKLLFLGKESKIILFLIEVALPSAIQHRRVIKTHLFA